MTTRCSSCHDVNDDDYLPFPAELLYLESFLLTLKREWTGIDRLRMDKFFQVGVKSDDFQRFKDLRTLWGFQTMYFVCVLVDTISKIRI